MEYVQGTDLSKLIETQGRLPAEQALLITKSVCEALQYVHSHGLIHRDINPAKILVNPATGRAWLIGISFVSRLPRGHVPAAPEEGV